MFNGTLCCWHLRGSHLRREMRPRNCPACPRTFCCGGTSRTKIARKSTPSTRLSRSPRFAHTNRPSLINCHSLEMTSLPKWKDMPPVKGMPHGCAWGLWDNPGEPKDQLGSLNLLTPEVIKEAFSELQTGERCALKSVSRNFSWRFW